MNKTEIDKKDVSAVPVNVLAVMESAVTFARAYRLLNTASDYEVAHNAVRELIEASDDHLRQNDALSSMRLRAALKAVQP